MIMKPWREVAVPHRDVLEGSFQQSEFAADITAVNTGKAPPEYQDAVAFFERTFITEGMGILLIQVVLRLSGKGGEAVIQLQTAFGGGKTHTELAVYHLATHTCALSDLVGIPALIDRAGLMEVPRARVAVLDGMAHAPGQPWRRGKQTINTLWGELAWQLGGQDAFALVAEADATGTSPGKEVLRDLLELHAPCVVLIDELVAYVRQFPEGKALSGGTYDSNLSFLQALTEAVKLVPTAMVLASLPESEVEAGSHRGVGALRALEKTFGRVQALWKPVATQDALEIVRLCRCLRGRGYQASGRDPGRALLRPSGAGVPDPSGGLRPPLRGLDHHRRLSAHARGPQAHGEGHLSPVAGR
jgi:predicted AAA+ superfamily ATPase